MADESEMIQKLLSSGMNSNHTSILHELRRKYNDEKIVQKIYDAYKQRHREISHVAEKIAAKVRSKYSDRSTQEILDKLKHAKDKYGFSDSEYHLFTELVFRGRPSQSDFRNPDTPLTRALGKIDNTGSLSYTKEDLPTLEAITKLHYENEVLHQSCMIQSLMHKAEVESGYQQVLANVTALANQNIHLLTNVSWLHPVLVALYLPRFEHLDRRTIMASLPSIVTSLFNNEPINTQPDAELLRQLRMDPDGISCAGLDSPFVDLQKRSLVQVELWKAVNSLRQGKLFNDLSNPSNLSSVLQSCRIPMIDGNNRSVISDEIHYLKKLFSVFGVRPSIVVTDPMVENQQSYVYQSSGLKVTSLPTVSLHLPQMLLGTNDTQISIKQALQSSDWISQDKYIVRKQRAVYSSELLVVTVNRSSSVSNVIDSFSVSFQQPLQLLTNQSLNTTKVNYTEEIGTGAQKFKLASIVYKEMKSYEVGDKKTAYPVGVSCMITRNNASPLYYNYINRQISQRVLRDSELDKELPLVDTKHINNNDNNNDNNNETYFKQYGVIYIFRNDKDEQSPLNVYSTAPPGNPVSQ